ncbi:hypothetical protein CI109_100687 [Kwoniella shandongensis]|uniref:Uncharacterized protein n=1 Tax=Kwoniella shandongensis TaxID=1734106 RepID=A0A5M6BZ90_9TREE|nr:uncharacterized protein CI109_003392 [Kwoniella shandongensis]KAA5528104.1 hypothetical protein CI109_003392 [Kwoniella shandongensis]
MSSNASPPPLPPSTLTLLLSSLLPPSPLPQELLSKSLLQRLLYLPPSPTDLDAHISPFPSNTEDQPISSRLRELARGHKLTEVEYTTEGEEVFGRVRIVPELEGGSTTEGEVEIWFEFEGIDGESRGWVYHSARLPVGQNDGSRQWVKDPSLLPSTSNDHQEQQQHETSTMRDGMGSYSLNDDEHAQAQAPAGYWAAFDSPPKAQNTFDLPSHIGAGGEGEGGEDDYWAQYSRPATAPITPGVATPGGPSSASGGVARHFPGMTNTLPSQVRTANGADHNGLGHRVEGEGDGLQLGLLHALNGAKDSQPRGIWKDETGVQVRDRLKGKIGNSLKDLWGRYLGEATSMDQVDDEVLEERAMGWLRISRSVVDSTPTASTITADGDEIVIRAKLEVLKEMYEVVEEQEHEDDGFWRLCEGVVKSQRGGEVEDEEVRQTMYYE